MYKLFLLLCLFALPLLGFSQQNTYSRVRIFLDGKNPATLLQNGIDLTGGNPKAGWVTSELSAAELARVSGAGFRYEVLINDMQKYYLQRNEEAQNQLKNTSATTDLSAEWPVPANFSLGTCGGFLTVDAMAAQLDLMRTLYPNLISVKQSISDSLTTIEGRPIYYVKISNYPDSSQNKPQVLYTGMHHAREPIGMQHLLYYMWYLLENYSTNADVQNVVDNTELYFVPVINMDGYSYNIATNPAGAGMWRKNRRNTGGGNFGIDINRNYGYMWGYDDTGSSPDPSSETYRGVAPFSEPETRMIKYFCESHDFRIAINFHSFANDFLYAWGWSPEPTPDEALFNAYAVVMTKENNYTYGPGNTTIYPTNGGSDDWMYGEQTTKPLILAYTPEIGGNTDGFWPSVDRIIPLCQENMLASFTAARLVGKFGTIADASPLFIYQDNGYLNFDVTRLGMQDGDFTVTINPLGSAFASVGPALILSGMSILEKRTDSIPYHLAAGLNAGDTLRYVLILNNGYYTVSDTVSRIWGYPYPVFVDKLDTKNNWTGNWGLTTASYYSAPTSMTDSPFGNYQPNANSSTTLKNPISIPASTLTTLEFQAHWALEAGYDYVQVKVSDNNGTTWTPLTGKYTHPGSSNQLPGQPLYDGSEGNWVREAFSLNAYQGKSIKIRFTLRSDVGTEMDGYYFDDFTISNLLDPTSIGENKPVQATLGIPTPNPANGLVRINYTIPATNTQPVLRVYSTSGVEKISSVLMQHEGWSEFSVKDWPAGVYFIRLEAPGIPAQVKKLVVY